MIKFVVLMICLKAIVIADHIDRDAEVKSFTSDFPNQEGNYHFAYDTSNGISVEETGNAGLTVTGNAQWVAPDGTPVQFSYVADENGYQAEGSHIPTPPPIPEYVVRALDWIQAHPPPQELLSQQQQQRRL